MLEVKHSSSLTSDTMATQTVTNINIRDVLCTDPDHGSIYRMLFNGGSWFEADQMHWRIIQQQAVQGLQEIVKTKPTKGNKEKAQTLLGELKETTGQLLPQADSMRVFLGAEQVVKTWAPAVKPPAKVKTNVFALLSDDEE